MTSQPPHAAGPVGDDPAAPAAGGTAGETNAARSAHTTAATAPSVDAAGARRLAAPGGGPRSPEAGPADPLQLRPHARPRGAASGPRPLPPVRASEAAVELMLDLRATPPDKVLPRLFGALGQVGDDVVLLVIVRDTPEYVGVTASAHQALQQRGYAADTTRLPEGAGQRVRVRRRRADLRPARAVGDGRGLEPGYAPPPAPALDREEPPVVDLPPPGTTSDLPPRDVQPFHAAQAAPPPRAAPSEAPESSEQGEPPKGAQGDTMGSAPSAIQQPPD